MFKGILFVLLALCLNQAYARDTSSSAAKVKTVLVVSVLDDIAFTNDDVKSLERFVTRKLPDHQFILISTHVSKGGLPNLLPEVAIGALNDIGRQITEKIQPHHEITHFILMDHGNTFGEGEWSKTNFSVFNYVGVHKIHMDFVKTFLPLAGKFSQDAFVMLESCSTACGDVEWSAKRMSRLMSFLRIENGTVFAADRKMISIGYEWGYHAKKIGQFMYHPFALSTALVISSGLEVFISSVTGLPFDWFRSASVFVGIDVFFGVVSHMSDLLEKLGRKFNLGYLFKYKNSEVEKVYELNPYKNMNELYLKLEPTKFKLVPMLCKPLFQ